MKNLVFETSFRDVEALLPEMERALEEFMVFSGCRDLTFVSVRPDSFKHLFGI